MKSSLMIVGGFGVVLSMLLSGCAPKDVSLMEEGTKLELMGRYAEAVEKYAGAAALGNPNAFKKLGDLSVAVDFLRLAPVSAGDFVNGYDQWLVDAKQSLEKAKDFYDKAKIAGCTNRLDVSLAKLADCERKYVEVEAKVAKAKEEDRIQKDEERRKKEEQERIARQKREEAERIAREEAEQKAEEERKRQEAEEAERKRLAEEESKKNSPEYCIQNGIVLNDVALSEVIKEIKFRSHTGNEIFDDQENERHWSRFRNSHVVVSGYITKVQVTMFTREVKVIVRVKGGTISARFDGMSRDEAAGFRTGDKITFEGDISNRPVTSTFAMDRCSRR